MLKMLKAKMVSKSGKEMGIRTYADDKSNPEEVFADFISGGFTIKSYEWIDTLSEPRKEWNRDHPDMQIDVES